MQTFQQFFDEARLNSLISEAKTLILEAVDAIPEKSVETLLKALANGVDNLNINDKAAMDELARVMDDIDNEHAIEIDGKYYLDLIDLIRRLYKDFGDEAKGMKISQSIIDLIHRKFTLYIHKLVNDELTTVRLNNPNSKLITQAENEDYYDQAWQDFSETIFNGKLDTDKMRNSSAGAKSALAGYITNTITGRLKNILSVVRTKRQRMENTNVDSMDAAAGQDKDGNDLSVANTIADGNDTPDEEYAKREMAGKMKKINEFIKNTNRLDPLEKLVMFTILNPVEGIYKKDSKGEDPIKAVNCSVLGPILNVTLAKAAAGELNTNDIGSEIAKDAVEMLKDEENKPREYSTVDISKRIDIIPDRIVREVLVDANRRLKNAVKEVA